MSQHGTFNLDAVGLTRNQSSRYQAEARVPDEVFEKWVEDFDKDNDELTQTQLLRLERGLRKEEKVAELNSVATIEAKAVQGVYDVIVIDPPWPMERCRNH